MSKRAQQPRSPSRKSGAKKRPGVKLAQAAPRVIAPRAEEPLVAVIGIGASAGGLEAFSQLLSRWPAQSGAALVLVQHLDPRHESLLTTLLAKKSHLPVLQLGVRTRVQPNCVYVVPPARSLRLVGAYLRTAALAKAAGGPSLIDQFFVSLASSRQRRAVGVLLSGSGHDGVLGLKAIQEAGGTTLCQSPSSAQIAGMPQAAVSARAADLVLDPPELTDELVRIARTLSASSLPVPEHGDRSDNDELGLVLSALHKSSGVDFSTYKLGTVRRRLARRMALAKLDSLASYARRLLSHPAEASALAEDLLIRVTRFFRDAPTYAALKRVALPRILAERSGKASLRIWVPGCATGEEVYSLAISVLEYLADRVPMPTIQIFGTDISEVAIAKARTGLYSAKIASDVPRELLSKYFTKLAGGYQIARQVRALCAFARHDVTLDPPFSRLDLISCRNVLIYHTVEAQQRTLSMFHYALLPDGVLLLGSSESTGARPDLFSALATRERIFAKKTARTHALFHLPAAEPKRALAAAVGGARASAALSLLATKEADRVLLGKFSPAAVLVDPELQIIQFRGQPGPYIRPVSGAASLSALKMVHSSLSPALHQALRPVKGAIKASSRTVTIEAEGELLDVRMEVLPIHVAEAPGYALVVFQDSRPREEKAPRVTGKTRSSVERLTRELASARDHLQSLIAEHEAAHEALHAALAAGQSSNEELQSTNEELETAKEELQSTNEELSTVNDELQARNIDLNQLNNDLAHVLASIDMPVLTLDRDARIRRFNQAAERFFQLLPADIGRAFWDVRTSLPGIDLASVVAQVIKKGKPAEAEVRTRDKTALVLHARPYPSDATTVDGVIITLVPARKIVDKRNHAQPAQKLHSSRESGAASQRKPK